MKEIADYLNALNSEDKIIYLEIANYVFSLGYKAKRAKTQGVNYVFTNSKTKKHLLKFSLENAKPVLKMKFYASNSYSSLFHEGVRLVIEEFNYKYTGCYKCGKCKGTLMGYTYEYPNGKKYFRCGSELISLPPITKAVVPEVLNLLKIQHEYYLSNEV